MASIEEITKNETVKFAGQLAKAIEDFFMALLKEIKENQKFKAQMRLIEWMKDGGKIFAVTPPGYSLEKLLFEMEKEQIPYFAISEDSILIRDIDKEIVEELNRQILVAEKNYFQEVPAKELETAINARSGGRSEVLTISNLNEFEYETLKRKCNDICKGFTVGREEQDGDYSLTVNCNRLYSSDPEQNDFCKAYIQFLAANYGINAEQRIEEINADKKFQQSVEQNIKENKEFYICGLTNKDTVIQVDANGLYVNKYENKDNELTYETVLSVQKSDPNFNYELLKAMDQVMDKTIVEDYNLVRKHLVSKNGKRILEANRPIRNWDQSLVSIGESKLTDKLDTMIKEKMSESVPQQPLEVFNKYLSEYTSIIGGLESGNVPAGYKEEDIKELRDIMKNFKLISDKDRYFETKEIATQTNRDVHVAVRFPEYDKLHEKIVNREQGRAI